MILATLAAEVRNLSSMFLGLQKFDLKEDKLELEYLIIIKTWWLRETKDSTMKTFVENLR